MKNIVLTGDRPTGRLHIGHYVGSLRERKNLQDQNNYDDFFIMIADTQALTDNAGNPQKVRDNVIEVMLDYLSIGLDPEKVHFFIQSEVPALTEITTYYMNLVTLQRALRNPTVKSEISMRGFEDGNKGTPIGFVNYPISQASDITTFKANIVPVGEDQLPMIEQSREIVNSFNNTYKTDVLVLPNAKLPDNESCLRLPGIDGKSKMSKSLGNCIFMSDTEEEVSAKVMKMYTDPDHIKVEDPGKVEGNVVFIYLDALCNEEHFKKYLSDYNNLDELKAHYQKGGLGDMKIKRFLINVINETLAPIREKRKYYESRLDEIFKYLEEGTKYANIKANETLAEIKKAIGLSYFDDDSFINEQKDKYKNVSE